MNKLGILPTIGLLGLATAGHADQVITDDLIVNDNGSLTLICVGADCVDGEIENSSFGGVLRLKSNNNRIEFDDTSVSSEFPARDWHIQANETTGGADGDAFFIRDVTNSTNPFYIKGGAPSHSVFVASDADIGLGTNLPETDLHITGNTVVGVMLESTSFNSKWELEVGNSSFALGDRITGNFPFAIENGTPSNALKVLANGNVGLGFSTPHSALHVRRAGGQAKILVESQGVSGAQEMFQMKNTGGSYFTLTNTNSGRDWFFTHENASQGRFIITSSSNPSNGLFYSPNGNMQIGGTLTENSDKHAKMAIVPVDAAAILDKVAELPVSSWTYKDDAPGIRHIGPMAQDFYAAFGLGATETGIATLDTSGVALASIKALHAQNEAMRVHHDQQIAALMARIEVLEAQ